MSPTAPTFVTLNNQLIKAHRRIRELRARETELLAQNGTLHPVITELTDEDARTAAELCSSPLPTPSSSDVRVGIGEQASQRLDPAANHRHRRRAPRRRRHPAWAGTASKHGGRHMFDLDPIGAMFLIIAVLWLIAAVVYGR
jgi:hypothetical protein